MLLKPALALEGFFLSQKPVDDFSATLIRVTHRKGMTMAAIFQLFSAAYFQKLAEHSSNWLDELRTRIRAERAPAPAVREKLRPRANEVFHQLVSRRLALARSLTHQRRRHRRPSPINSSVNKSLLSSPLSNAIYWSWLSGVNWTTPLMS